MKMEKCVLVSLLALLVILFIVSSYGYSQNMVKVTGKWLKYTLKNKIEMYVDGVDENGYECRIKKILPRENYFPNGILYLYCSMDSTKWYVCQLIHKKDNKYYVVGFAILALYYVDDGMRMKLDPAFLFSWGVKLCTQKIYMDIDFGRCPEISSEYVTPITFKLLREKYIYDKVNGEIPDGTHQNTEQILQMEELKQMFEINRSE